jgi:hypothetical protein
MLAIFIRRRQATEAEDSQPMDLPKNVQAQKTHL